MRPTFFSMLVAVSLCLPLHAADTPPAPKIVPDPFAPEHFKSLYIDRDEGDTSIVIQLSGDAVTYTKTVKGQVVETSVAHPSGDDWFQFIQGLNQAKVYKWAPHYEYPGQGMTWAIDFVMEDRRFSSDGANEFPKEGAEDQPRAAPQVLPSNPFLFFWQAALTLAGKAPAAGTAK